MRIGMLAGLFVLLFTGFAILFGGFRLCAELQELFRRTQKGMDAAARKRSLESRQKLLQMQSRHGVWMFLERELNYTGLRLRFPNLTAEIWVTCNLLAVFGLGAALSLGAGPAAGAVGSSVFMGGEFLVLYRIRAANMRKVNGQMMKLLDFLGNYSITAGEITGILYQVSRYMQEPLKSVLESCYYEGQLTGDAGMALLAMAEKVEHPQFKELARNMEVGIRYCADFKALLAGSKRSLREYLKVTQEKKGMLREAVANMGLLLGLSAVILASVGNLAQISVQQILFGTLPGQVGLCVIAAICVLFIGQFRRAVY